MVMRFVCHAFELAARMLGASRFFINGDKAAGAASGEELVTTFLTEKTLLGPSSYFGSTLRKTASDAESCGETRDEAAAKGYRAAGVSPATTAAGECNELV